MQRKEDKNLLQLEEGMAIIETLPLLVLFVILLSYGVGMWGAIHTATLHSIAARTFAFETFRNRTHLTYFRDDEESGVNRPQHYKDFEFRWHGIQSINPPDDSFYATQRPIALGLNTQTGSPPDTDAHNITLHDDPNIPIRNRTQGGLLINPIWIMVGYGMCLNPNCGGGGP